MEDMIVVEIQYFKDCPNSIGMIERVKDAIQEFDSKINYFEILVEDNLTAQKVSFRGSPTLLINGQDFENLEESKNPKLSCRLYNNGLPTIEKIKNIIQIKIAKDQI